MDQDTYIYTGYYNYAIRRIDSYETSVSIMAGKFCSVNDIDPTCNNASAGACVSDGNATTADLTKSRCNTLGGHIVVGANGDKVYLTDYMSGL